LLDRGIDTREGDLGRRRAQPNRRPDGVLNQGPKGRDDRRLEPTSKLGSFPCDRWGYWLAGYHRRAAHHRHGDYRDDGQSSQATDR
jgi:hypothetical protein